MWAVLAAAQPDTVDYYQRGQAKQQQGDFDGAVADYTRAIEADPKSSAAYIARGNAREHDSRGAMADFNRAIELDPKSAPAYNYRGWAKFGQGDWQGSLADYSRAIELDPKYVNAFVNRAMAKGSQPEAIVDWTRAIELRPQAFFYNERANIKLCNDDPRGALEDYNRAITLDSKSARYGLRAEALHALGDLEGAVADFTRVLDAEPKTLYAYDCRGALYMCLHRWTDALADYRHALTLSDYGLEDTRLHVWTLRTRLGEGEAASKELAESAAKRRERAPEEWPFKVMDHLLGQMTEAELFVAAAEAPDPRTQGVQECEAYYYGGMKKLLTGDKTGAAVDFRKCLATGHKEYREYQFAEDELKSLAP